MARGDPGPHAGADPGSRPRDDRGVEVDGHSGLVAPRDCLHRGGIHEGREAHVRPGGQDPRPIAPLQFQLGRHNAKGDRHPRRGEGRRGRVQGAREGRSGPEWPAGEETVDPETGPSSRIIEPATSRPMYIVAPNTWSCTDDCSASTMNIHSAAPFISLAAWALGRRRPPLRVTYEG